MLLKKAVVKGYTPSRIASIMCRDGSQKSALEKVHLHALQLCGHKTSQYDAVEDVVYMKHVSEALDEVLVD